MLQFLEFCITSTDTRFSAESRPRRRPVRGTPPTSRGRLFADAHQTIALRFPPLSQHHPHFVRAAVIDQDDVSLSGPKLLAVQFDVSDATAHVMRVFHQDLIAC